MEVQDPSNAEKIVSVCVEVAPFHLDRAFQYLVPDGLEVGVGWRVMVPFGGRRVRGLVVGFAREAEVEASRLKPIARVLGSYTWVRDGELEVLRWAAARFGAPLADVVRHALPARTVDVERRAEQAGWFPPGRGRRPASDPAPDEAALGASWAAYGDSGAALVEAARDGSGSFLWRPVPGEDVAARVLELAQVTLAAGRDVLLVVPDRASLVADALVREASDLVVDFRGGPSPRVGFRMWLEARCGQARVVVGERGAVFVPLERLGLAVVLDEANPALKERRSPRHHARDVIFERARRAGAVGLAVGTVPSAVGWRLLRERRVVPVVADREVERQARPRVNVVSEEPHPRARFARASIAALREATEAGHYAVVLASRRGEGRALVCKGCGERLACPKCASSLALHGSAPACEGCGWAVARVPRCGECGAREVVPLAAGAARVGAELRRTLKAPVAVLEGYGQPAPPAPAVLVMTRGSVLDAPPGRVGAVVLPDLDGALKRPSLDAAEDTLRLACAVAGWTVHGRADPAASTVVVQTRDPRHHVIQALASWDPGGFWRTEVALREPLQFPPLRHAIRVEVADDRLGAEFAEVIPGVDEMLGPLPVDGRSGFLIKSVDRAGTLEAIAPVRAAASQAGVECRVDVDPVDAL